MRRERLSPFRRIRGRFSTRMAADVEWSYRATGENHELELEFFDDRVVYTINFQMQGDVPMPVTSVEGRRYDEDWRPIDFVLETNRTPMGPLVSVHLQPQAQVNRVRLRIEEAFEGSFHTSIALQKQDHADLRGLRRGMSWATGGFLTEAVDEFERYRRVYSDRNPFVNFNLALWYAQLGQISRGHDRALRACAIGALQRCLPAYQAVEKARPDTPLGEIRALQEGAADWKFDEGHGAVVLEQRRELIHEIDEAVYADLSQAWLEIRRPSAARLLNRLGFGFEAGRDAVLFTRCRVIRGDDRIEVVPDDQMTVHEDQDGSPLITLEHRRVVSWILPELHPGDIVESTFHRLRRGVRVGGRSWPGRVDPLADARFPTWHASLAVIAPKDVALRIAPVNCDLPVQKLPGSLERNHYVVVLDRYVAPHFTGLDHEAALLNPAVAVGPEGATWQELATARRAEMLEADGDDPLPKTLDAIVREHDDPAKALEQCFYVIRDDVKYAAVLSAKKRIGSSGRADQILASGIGDCSDKSYLLHLVCRELKIPYHLVLFDARWGGVCEDVPNDVFDHVVVRARIGDRELWLDAANHMATFGSIPEELQGATGLVLDDAGTIVRVPQDDASANRVVIRERLDHIEGQRIAGTLELEATGTSGRMLEERFKMASLGLGGLSRGNLAILRESLPELFSSSLEVLSQATHSNLLRIRGTHERGHLSTLSESGNRTVRLSWGHANLRLWDWPNLDSARKLKLGTPMEFRVELELSPALRAMLVDRSTCETVDNELYSVSEGVAESDGWLRITRECVLKRGIVEAPLTGLVGDLTRDVTRMSSLVMQFGGAAGSGG